jgi:DNA repair protein RadC
MNQRDLNTIAEAINILGNSLKTFGLTVDSGEIAKDFLTLQMAALEHEVFGVLFLNTQNQLNAAAKAA